jgi:hypothetical protein
MIIFVIKSNDELSKNVKYYLYNYEKSLHQTKMVACMNLVEYSVANNKNKNLYDAIKITNFNKEKFYYKFLIGMITKCINNINDNLIDYLISPENLNNYDLNNKTLSDLIEIKGDFNTITLTEEEELIYDEIQDNLKETEENKKDVLGSGLSKLIKVVIIFLIIIISILGTQFFMNRKKPEIDDATKEMIEMIKQRGKKSPKYNENINKDNKNDKKEKKE